MKSISYIHHPMVSSTIGIFRTYSPLIPYISPTLLVAESGDVHFLLLHEFCKILLQMANSSILISRLTSFRNDNFSENSKLKAFADDNSKFDENDKVLQAGRKHCGKRRYCLLQAISPFPKMLSKVSYCKHVKSMACLGKS